MSVFCLDASVFLDSVLPTANYGRFAAAQPAVSSELLRLEANRTIDRMRVRGELAPDAAAVALAAIQVMLRSVELIPIDSSVLQRAAMAPPVPLGSLDSIYLATALLWAESTGQTVTLLTRDKALDLAARACGLQVRSTP